jgi:predicted cobalt transporter CbtA
VAVAVVVLILPGIHETPSDFPADVLYEFRLYSLGTQLVMWAAIGLVFAPMVARLLGEARRAETVDA